MEIPERYKEPLQKIVDKFIELHPTTTSWAIKCQIANDLIVVDEHGRSPIIFEFEVTFNEKIIFPMSEEEARRRGLTPIVAYDAETDRSYFVWPNQSVENVEHVYPISSADIDRGIYLEYINQVWKA